MYLNTNTNTFHFGKLKYKYKYLKKKYLSTFKYYHCSVSDLNDGLYTDHHSYPVTRKHERMYGKSYHQPLNYHRKATSTSRHYNRHTRPHHDRRETISRTNCATPKDGLSDVETTPPHISESPSPFVDDLITLSPDNTCTGELGGHMR